MTNEEKGSFLIALSFTAFFILLAVVLSLPFPFGNKSESVWLVIDVLGGLYVAIYGYVQSRQNRKLFSMDNIVAIFGLQLMVRSTFKLMPSVSIYYSQFL
jgi:hypothetical protein